MEQQVMREAHEKEVEEYIYQATFEEIKVNDDQLTLAKVWEELELECGAKVKAKQASVP